MVCFEMLTGLPPWYTQDKELLFERLRKAPLKFPTFVSRPASSFIHQLLNRDPQLRLGSSGAAAVKEHAFFDSIEWDALLRRQVRPPFNPLHNQDAEDSRNFEREFTSLPLGSIDDIRGGAGAKAESRAERVSSSTFENFTYEEDSYLDSRSG